MKNTLDSLEIPELYPISTSNPKVDTISMAASILGIDANKLLAAFKTARIGVILNNIKKGIINMENGVELIQKIEKANDLMILPK